MAYTLLHGEFVIRYDNRPLNQGPQPDGDTVKFKPTDPKLLKGLRQISGIPPDINTLGTISVRLEAIDALETHFKQTHQELDGGKLARDTLLAYLGFKDVVFVGNNVESANHDQLPGYVLSNGIDANGRLIGFIFKGSNNEPGRDGSTVTLDTEHLDKSVNAKLLSDGHVYPAFYGTLSPNLRDHLAAKSKAARTAKKGIWPRSTADTTNGAAKISDVESLTTLVLWPKLFRRLVDFLSSNHNGLSGFDAWLRRDPIKRDDSIFRLDINKHARFHDIITVDGDRIKINVEFEQVVFDPDPVS